LLLLALAANAAPQSPPDTGAELNRMRESIGRDQIKGELREENKRIDAEEQEKQEKEEDGKAQPKEQPTTFFLKKVEFSPSTILSMRDLQSLAEKYEQREISLGDLYQLVEEINQRYKALGYITAIAILTQQRIKDGIVKILLIEGKVGEVKLKGNDATNEDYILERIELPEGKAPNLIELDNQLQWFNGSNDAKLSIQLEAGKAAGTTDFQISVEEPDRHQFIFTGDNAGREDTGEFRAGLGYTNTSVTGRRDAFSFFTMASKSSQTALLQYGFPLNRLGTRLSAYYNTHRLKVTEGDLNDFNIEGKADYFGVTLTQPVIMKARFKQDVMLDIQKQNSKTTILGVEFVNDSEQRISLGTGLTYYGVGEVFYFKPIYVQGQYKGLFESKNARRIKADFIWQKQDSRRNIYSVTSALQKGLSDYLPSSDQFYLGGMYSIRGYRESILSADSGLSANLEARFPIKALHSSALVFLDAGKLSGKNILTTDTLLSAGFGLSLNFFKDSNATVTFGFPLKKKVLDENEKGWRVHFGINIRL
jgi:hemolysin activation/secretion protein